MGVMDWQNRWTFTFPWGVRFDLEPAFIVIRPKRGVGVCIAHRGDQDFIHRTFVAVSEGLGPFRMRWVSPHPSFAKYAAAFDASWWLNGEWRKR